MVRRASGVSRVYETRFRILLAPYINSVLFRGRQTVDRAPFAISAPVHTAKPDIILDTQEFTIRQEGLFSRSSSTVDI